jgi:hypothetical protein
VLDPLVTGVVDASITSPLVAVIAEDNRRTDQFSPRAWSEREESNSGRYENEHHSESDDLAHGRPGPADVLVS